jgi:outer membrane receptor protein involved in Fe transport
MTIRPLQLRQIEKFTSLTAAVLTALYGAHAYADNSAAAEAPESGPALEEVIVTASRRAVSAQDLPISITAVSGADLEQAGILDIADLAHSMAGVNYTDKGPFGGVNGSTLIIRGLNSEPTGGQLALATPVVPPVATYVDETPLFVNLRLQDLDHVEILRGPQGTLYGSGSLGGTIRFVQNAPDPSGFDARAEVGAGDTQHTHAPNEDINGMLNIPLSDTLAIRMNAGWTYDAGFINQPNLYVLNAQGYPAAAQPGNVFSPPETFSKDGVNSYDYRSARISALWKPNDQFKAQLSYYYQLNTADGFPYVALNSLAYNMPISPLTQGPILAGGPYYASPPYAPYATQLWNQPLPGGIDSLSNADNSVDTTHDRTDLAALTLEYNLGFATLTSATSWAHHVNQSVSDLTALYENFFFYQSIYGQNPRHFIQGRDELNDKPWSQELRLASNTGGLLDWVGGLFYKDQTTDIQEHEFYPGYLDFYNACLPIYGQDNPASLAPSYCGVGETAYTPGATNYVFGIPIVKDQAYIGDFETRYKDLAAFGELTGHLTSAWSVTGGTRVFKQTVAQSQQTGLLFDGGEALFGPVVPVANNALSASWRKALWKLNTSYQLDKTNLVYATWSQGFRRGGVNALPASEPAEDYVTPPALTKLTPDTADNYEVGAKGTVLNRFRYSAAVYEIQWHNVQEGIQLTPLVLPASVNIGDAYSQGFEMELDALLTQHFTLHVDYTYDHTKVTSISPLFAENASAPPPPPGGPLPGTPKTSLAGELAYEHVPFAGGELRYSVGAHYQSSVLPALSATIPEAAGYALYDARVTYMRAHWLASLYGTNLSNTLGISSYSDPALYGNRYQAIVTQPRTFGFSVAYSFKDH